MFVDLDKRDAILAKHQTTLTSQDIDSYQRVLSLPEVNPKGRGQIFAQQFIWTPLNLDHEHYEIAVTAKDRNLRQELQVENVEGKWVWATQIEDTESGAQLLSCKDPDFPYGAKARIRCFPEVSGYAD